jgi:predicted 3-demethylubiquinone-9 3-methyltransferase (glyoxalase superfamily)
MKPGETSITPFLMFTGKAEEAMDFYVSLFPTARIEKIERWGPNDQGAEGSVKLAITFTPSFSFFVSCAGEEEFEKYCKVISNEGKFLMPPDNYGFSTKFAWLQDRFGISWQLNLP